MTISFGLDWAGKVAFAFRIPCVNWDIKIVFWRSHKRHLSSSHTGVSTSTGLYGRLGKLDFFTGGLPFSFRRLLSRGSVGWFLVWIILYIVRRGHLLLCMIRRKTWSSSSVHLVYLSHLCVSASIFSTWVLWIVSLHGLVPASAIVPLVQIDCYRSGRSGKQEH